MVGDTVIVSSSQHGIPDQRISIALAVPLNPARYSGMEVEEGYSHDSPCDNDPAGQALYAAYAGKRRAEVAIAFRILIAMTAHPFTNDGHIFSLSLRMEFITDMATASLAAILVDDVGCS